LPQEERRQTGLKTFIVCGLLLASSGLAVLALWPGLDLAVARLFFITPGHFAGMRPEAQIFRRFAALFPFAIYVGAVLLYLAALAGMVPKRFGLSHRSLIFLTLSLALGPGLLVNELFKTQFHRPRPVHVAEFGGVSPFRPFYRQDGDCPKNCAFPSGESAAAFWTMAPAMLAPPPLRAAALGGAMLFGTATGVARMAAGAHFLSDVLFSGLMMGVLTIGLWFLTRRRQSDSDAVAKRGSKTGLREDLAPL
jgi:membrane-associated phospholipid phosphatase